MSQNDFKDDNAFIELSVEQVLNASSSAVENIEDSYYEFIKDFTPDFLNEHLDCYYSQFVNTAWRNIRKKLKWKPKEWTNIKYYSHIMKQFEDNWVRNQMMSDLSVPLGKVFGFINYNIDQFNFNLNEPFDVVGRPLADAIQEDVLNTFLRHQIVDYITGTSKTVTLFNDKIGMEFSVDTNPNNIRLSTFEPFNDIVSKMLFFNDNLFKTHCGHEKVMLEMDDKFSNISHTIRSYSKLYNFLKSYKNKLSMITEVIDMCNYTESESVHVNYEVVKLLKNSLESNEYAEIVMDSDENNQQSQSSVRFNKPVSSNNSYPDINDIDTDDDDTTH